MKTFILSFISFLIIPLTNAQVIFDSNSNMGINSLSQASTIKFEVVNDLGGTSNTSAAGRFVRSIGAPQASPWGTTSLWAEGKTTTDFCSGSIHSLSGLSAQTSHEGAGTVNSSTGIFGQVYTLGTGAGTITNAYGISASVKIILGGTITNGYGIYVNDIAGTNDYGVYQVSSDDDNYFAGSVGIGTSTPGYLLEVNGSAAKPGGGSWTSASDKRLKSNIRGFTDGLEKILQIEPIYYKYNGKAGLSTEEEYVGVVAQDLKKVAPYMVKNFEYRDLQKSKSEEYLGVDDTAIKYMLINAIKELNEKVDDLEVELMTYKQESNSKAVLHQQDVLLSGDNGYFLGQNIPNPYDMETTIPYQMSSEFGNATIEIFNISGQLLKSVPLKTGKGELKIRTLNLEPGIYTYSLVVDNRVIETKKMMVAR